MLSQAPTTLSLTDAQEMMETNTTGITVSHNTKVFFPEPGEDKWFL